MVPSIADSDIPSILLIVRVLRTSCSFVFAGVKTGIWLISQVVLAVEPLFTFHILHSAFHFRPIPLSVALSVLCALPPPTPYPVLVLVPRTQITDPKRSTSAPSPSKARTAGSTRQQPTHIRAAQATAILIGRPIPTQHTAHSTQHRDVSCFTRIVADLSSPPTQIILLASTSLPTCLLSDRHCQFFAIRIASFSTASPTRIIPVSRLSHETTNSTTLLEAPHAATRSRFSPRHTYKRTELQNPNIGFHFNPAHDRISIDPKRRRRRKLNPTRRDDSPPPTPPPTP